MPDLESGLLEWSERLADWQRDLLRRLAAGEIISASDIRIYANAAERKELEEEAPWYSEPELGEAPDFIPLDPTHLTSTFQGGDPVQIVKIVHIHGANDLADGAALDFNPVGLTIIAGRNGSGKSGFTRILKQVAVSRASEDVLPNAFGSVAPPKAVVSFRIGEDRAQDLTWESGNERVESPLQRVRVFDARVANVHLTGSTQVAFVPSTLEVLVEYTRVLREIEAVIDADLQQLGLQERHWPALEFGIGAEIFERIGEGDALSALRSVSALTPEEEEDLAGIPAKLRDLTSSNPGALAVQARQRAGQLTVLARNLELVAAKVSAEAIDASEKLRTNFVEAHDKAAEARRLVEVEGTSPGTANELWQEMWIAAKRYVEDNHSHHFPDVSEDAICPLCQQSLDAVARDRLAKFAEFMSGEAQTALTNARTLRTADVAALNVLPLDSLITQELVDLVGTYDEIVAGLLLPAIAEVTRIRDYLVRVDDRPESFAVTGLATTIDGAIKTLRSAVSGEITNAEALEATDTLAVAAVQLEARRESLTVRKGLAIEINAITAQHDRSVRANRLRASKNACNTTSASRKNSDLSSSYVNKVRQELCRNLVFDALKCGAD